MRFLTRRTAIFLALAFALRPKLTEALRTRSSFQEPAPPAYPSINIDLPRQDEGLLRFLKEEDWFEYLKDIAAYPGKELILHFFDESQNARFIAFSFFKNRLGFLIPQLRKDDGSIVTLRFANPLLSPKPSLRFADLNGKPIVQKNNKLDFPFDFSGKDFFEAGIAVVFAGLALWIGAHIAKMILAILATVAFFAMIVGILITGIAAAVYVGNKISPHLQSMDLDGLKRGFHERKRRLEAYLKELILKHSN